MKQQAVLLPPHLLLPLLRWVLAPPVYLPLLQHRLPLRLPWVQPPLPQELAPSVCLPLEQHKLLI